MRQGKNIRINWDLYLSPRFVPTKTNISDDQDCGTHAMRVLTGLNYKAIRKAMGKATTWSDRRAIQWLRSKGYAVVPVTVGSTSGLSIKEDKISLGGGHVLLVSQHCFLEEGTWSVLFENKIYHAGNVEYLDGFEFINYPIWSAYLIFKRQWIPKDYIERASAKAYSAAMNLYTTKNAFDINELKKQMHTHLKKNETLALKHKRENEEICKVLRSKTT